MNSINNTIIESPFNFYLISSNIRNWSFKEVKKGDSLIILKELVLTKAANFISIDTDAAHAAVRCTYPSDAFFELYEQAKEEYLKTGNIEGYEVLNLQTFDKLWLSHYGIEYLHVNNSK